MADFNVSLQAPQGQGAGVVAPVQPVGFGTMLNAGVDIAKAFLQGSAEAEKAKKEAMKQAILSEFSQKQSALSDAVMQGGNSREIMSRSRSNYSKFVGSYPELTKEFTEINKGLFEHSSLEDLKDEAQLFKDQRKADIAAASSAGFSFSKDDPEELIQSKLAMYKKNKLADEQFRRIREEQTYMNSKSAEDRAVWEHNNKLFADKYITEIGVSQLGITQKEIDNTIALVKSGKLSPQEADLKLAKHFSNIQSTIAAVTKGNTAMAEPWLRSFENMQKYAVAAMDPKAKAEDLENAKKAMVVEEQIHQLTSNPKLKRAASVSGLFGHNVLGLIPAISTDVLKVVKGSQEGKPVNILGTEVEKPTLDLIFKNISDLKSGKIPQPEVTKEGIKGLSQSIIDNVNTLAYNEKATYKDLFEVANYFAKPEWAFLVEQGLITPEANQKAKEVFQSVYQQETTDGILPKIRNRDGSLAADLNFVGAGIRIEPKNAGNLNYNQLLQRNAYLREVRPAQDVLNKLIHIGAHMEGHTDYAKYWEDNKHEILPGIYLKKGTLQEEKGVKYEYVGPYPVNDQRSWRKVKDADAMGD